MLFSRLLLSVLVLSMTACAVFKVDDDLARMAAVDFAYDGSVELENFDSPSIVVAALGEKDGSDVYAYRVLVTPGDFHFFADERTLYFFAYIDENRDLSFQPGEPFGWGGEGAAFDPRTGATDAIRISITADSRDRTDYPPEFTSYQLSSNIAESGIDYNVGTISSLDNPLFSEEQASKGLWKPYAFMVDGGSGVHFLEPYDPDRIPVLFVHGINGSPQNFRALIGQLDRSRYQAWVYSYPSGLKLSSSADGLVQMLNMLHALHGAERLHIIAHSMGGLVSRSAINTCFAKFEITACDGLLSYTTLSTPWGGVASARAGVKWSPNVVPVWRDMVPESDFIQTLFDTPLPDTTPHYLMFGFKQSSILSSESGDGVVTLDSTLRLEAQDQSHEMRGFDEDHNGILNNPDVIARVYRNLDSHSK
jgi:pimeloyl-ACP methyl ester carboxylesterase